ncbi:MAG TPA: ABC transporter permease [Thermoplasmata archaeon]|nr:ABC transporter permease [Thermoplasmata archaeon]
MSERHRLRSLWTLTFMNGIVPMRTQPLYLINTIASPLAFLFFILVVSQGRLLLYGIAGGLVLTMLSIGTSLQTDMTHYKQDLKFQDLVVASPVEAPIYVAGMALSEFVYALPGLAVFVFLWVGHSGWPAPWDGLTAIGDLVVVWAFASALGFTLATYFEDIRETFVFSPLISLGLSVLPPVYYSAGILPTWAQPLVYLSPTTYAADLLHQALHLTLLGPYLLPAWVDWLAILGWAVGLFLLAAFKARWREP